MGGDNSFHVDPAALASVIEILDKFERSAEQFISDVDKQVNDMHIDWKGAAAAGHLEAQKKWAVGAAEMREAVAELRKITHGAHGNYTAAINTNSSMWKRG